MSHQVLARKWRPGNFTEMVGQQHVLQALVNALAKANGRTTAGTCNNNCHCAVA